MAEDIGDEEEANMTLADLREMAADEGIDLTGVSLRKKADILQAIHQERKRRADAGMSGEE
jgi:hypothetical protein